MASGEGIRAVVLAGGDGARMAPFGETQAKALLPVGARPLLAGTLEELAAAGVTWVRVVAGGRHAQAVTAFATRAGVDVVTTEAPGTAAALLAAMEDMEDMEGTGAAADGQPILCIFGDVWFGRGVLSGLVERARAGAVDAAWALAVPLGAERPQDWICVAVEGDAGAAGDGSGDGAGVARAHGWRGHPRSGSHRSGGAFWLPPGFGRYLRANPGQGVRVPVGGMPPAESYLEESLNLFLEDGGRVWAVVPRRPVWDLDKPWHLLAANEADLAQRFGPVTGIRLAPGAEVDPTAALRAPVVLEEGARIGPGVIVHAPLYVCAGGSVTDGAIVAGPSLVGPGSHVREYARLDGAVLGADVVVGHCAEVSGVVMAGARIVHYCELSGVVGRSVDIGAATVCGTLRFDDGASRQRVGGAGGRWEVPAVCADAAYFGDFSRTGVNVTLLPGRSVGAYACVGPGVVVAQDVPPRTLVLLAQELEHRPWGPERYGW